MSCFWSAVYSQDRVNKKLPKISSQIFGTLTSATGWLNNPEGQWIFRKNRIVKNLNNSFKSIIDYEENGLGIDNFIFYQLRKILINDTSYYILIKKSNSGYYRYATIREDWTPT